MSLKVLVLTGPTGTGKTDWAIAAAERFALEIVSVDSALVYRGLDVGTAKPSLELRQRVPHHLIDIRDPAEGYSAGHFVSEALRVIADIQSRGAVPLLVGGTMLYLRALTVGLAELPQGSPDLRRSLDARAAREGWPALHRELGRLDPAAAARIHPNDPQRIQRALEVYYASGTPISQLQRQTASPLAHFEVHRWALVPSDRPAWHARLAQRFDAMMDAGFLEEVARLRSRGDLSAGLPAMRAVGYRQLWAYLTGEYDLQEARERAIVATRHLAKRQLTWLRAEGLAEGLNTFDPRSQEAFEAWCRALATALR